MTDKVYYVQAFAPTPIGQEDEIVGQAVALSREEAKETIAHFFAHRVARVHVFAMTAVEGTVLTAAAHFDEYFPDERLLS